MHDRLVRRVVVTGHDGYVGAVLCAKLVQAGYDVVGVDTSYYGACIFGTPGQSVPAIRKDVRDVTADDLRGFDAVIHLAALPNDPRRALAPELTLAINHSATLQLASAARAAGIRRFLFASSCSLYGNCDREWVDEGSPVAPLTPYAESKLLAEAELLSLVDEGFAPVILRCATVYGISTKLRVDLVVNNLVGCGVTTGEVRILGDGTPWRPLIHVEDLAAAYVYLLKAPKRDVRGLVLNVGFDDQNYQVREIAEVVRRALPRAFVTCAGERDEDRRTYRVHFARFRDLADFPSGRWNLESGVRQLVGAYHAPGLTLEDFGGPKFKRLHQIRLLLDAGRLDQKLRWTQM